jgi:hypothetical protein
MFSFDPFNRVTRIALVLVLAGSFGIVLSIILTYFTFSAPEGVHYRLCCGADYPDGGIRTYL